MTDRKIVFTPFQKHLRARMPVELLFSDAPLSKEDAAEVIGIAIWEHFAGWPADPDAVAQAAVEGLYAVRPRWFE